jgi:hypothetical protein
VVGLVGRILKRGEDIFFFQERIVRQNLFERCTCGEHFENVCNADSLSANARATAALSGFNADPTKSISLHRSLLSVTIRNP